MTVVLTESSREILSFPDIAGDVLDRVRDVTKEEIDAIAVSLFPGEETTEGCAGSAEDVARPA